MSGSALTKDLIGPALDWAVAKCEGREWHDNAWKCLGERHYFPSTDWSQGGPIIEREHVTCGPQTYGPGTVILGAWWAVIGYDPDYRQHIHEEYGPTPLIAAMRAYVASKLGDTVDVPEDLL